MVFRIESSELGSKVEIKGTLYLTTIRIVFVPSITNTYFTAIDLPLQGITQDKFEQPIFGSNYLQGTIAPVPGRGLINPAKFRLYFHDGGAGTFLHVYFGLMEKLHHTPRVSVNTHPPPLFTAPQLQSFIEEQQAYVDPSDPSVLYIAQPEVTQVTAPGVIPNTGVPNGGWNNFPPPQQPMPSSSGSQGSSGYYVGGNAPMMMNQNNNLDEDPSVPSYPSKSSVSSYPPQQTGVPPSVPNMYPPPVSSSSTTTIITSGIVVPPSSSPSSVPQINPTYANYATNNSNAYPPMSSQPQPNPAYNSGYGAPVMMYNQQQPSSQTMPPNNSYPPTMTYPPQATANGYGPPAMMYQQQQQQQQQQYNAQQPGPATQYGNGTVIRGFF
jgi:hypothetical protein